MTLWNVACKALDFYFLQSDLLILVEKSGNTKRIECLSNDSTVLISVLLGLCKEFHTVYNSYQFELVYLQCFSILTSYYHCG